jgi:hypothetical protein
MRTYKPGMAYYDQFCTQQFDSGESTDADALPVAVATKNGIDDAAFVLTVAKIDTGRYMVTGTVPATYTTNDVVQISVTATVNGISGKAVINDFIVEEDVGANTVTITVEEADHTPIPDVSVEIYNAAQTVKLKSGMTDVNGQLVVALNDGSYKIRLSKAMVNFTTPETLTVSGATAKTCTGVPVSVTAPSAGLQTIYIILTDLGLEYSPTMSLWAIANRLNTIVDTAVISNQILLAEDKGTYFEMQIAKGAVVTITGQNGDSIFYKKEITIDTNDTKNLSDY